MTLADVLAVWMTPGEAAAWVSAALWPAGTGTPLVTERKVRDRARAGAIDRNRVGRRVFVARASVDAWVSAMTADAGLGDAA